MSALSAAIGPEPPTTSECRPVVQPTVGFNYAGLDPDVAIGAREAADRIRSRTGNYILDTGRDLIAGIGYDLPETLCALYDFQDLYALRELLTKGAAGLTAAHAGVPA